MKKLPSSILIIPIFILVVLLIAPSPGIAAQAQNIDVRLEGSRAVVTFDIPGDRAVGVEVALSDDRGPLKVSPGSLSGDVGKAVAPGKDKTV